MLSVPTLSLPIRDFRQPGVAMAGIQIKLPVEMVQLLDQEAARLGTSRGALSRALLDHAINDLSA